MNSTKISWLITIIIFLVGLKVDALTSTERVHFSTQKIGETASLPCDVDFSNCGNIYFLTWSKNVSNEWQRVFLYSESYQTPMGLYAYSKRTFLDAKNMSKSGVAVLQIREINLQDEGSYKCDV